MEHNYTENYDTSENIITKNNIKPGKDKNSTHEIQEKPVEEHQAQIIGYIIGGIIVVIIIIVLGILIVIKICKNMKQQQKYELEMAHRASWTETLSVLQKSKENS